ncbi:15 kDa calcium-binding protein [Octopus bimaculoides]|uniref:EF-hand domain-containing protein n=1 Tax=Octopus bimaculoides TaxID=37653 RepID=A0A0L8IFL0_OCTBM|nr:15 kDa calcium-binding protein [Octopus bimaculoides]|eukprot:XP_014769871.1 PREDICTED: 15 kDa calcium-binding protein-like [Octopus bimaculoides]
MSGFGSIDKTGDGLSLDEFVEYLKEKYGVKISKDLARGVFNDIDCRRSDDDRIVWEEWEEFLKSKPFSDVQKDDLIKVFDDADADGNGKLCSAELSNGLSKKDYSNDDIAKFITDYDTDSDKLISRTEWVKMVEDYIKQKA